MNVLLFNPDYMDKYYNCSGRTYEEWKALGQPNIILGFVYATLGVIYLSLLFPFMMVFIKSDFMQYSCYKIMFVLGIMDCLELPIGCFYGGYATAIGMIYCMAPTVNYILGSLVLSCWCGSAVTCMILAINRCLDLINPQFGQKLFAGKKTIIWLTIPVFYFLYFFFFHPSVIFNSNQYAFFFDPFVGTPERHGLVDSEHYPHIIHSINNITVVIVLLTTYSCLFIHLSIRASKSHDLIRMSRLQRQIFFQCTLVCGVTFIAALIYVYMQFMPTPLWMVISAQITWQTIHGAAGISYAFFNPTMKKELMKVFCSNVKITPNTGTSNATKNSVPGKSQPTKMNY